MAELKTSIKTESPVKRKITVTVPVELVTKGIEEHYIKIGKDAKLKGFRKGKVPRNVLEQYYKDQVLKDAMEGVVRETYPQAIDKEMALPISAPYVEVELFEEGKEFTYHATFEIKPEIKLVDYEGLKLEKPETTVKKEEIEQQLEHIRQRMTQLEPLPEGVKAEKGMVVVLDFDGTADGQSFKGSDVKDFYAEVGSGQMLPAIDAAVTGTSKNDEKNIEFDYPKDYFNPDVAGKHAKFRINVKDIRKKIVPELNDEFAKDLGSFATLEDLKKDVEKNIFMAKEQEAKNIISSEAIKQLIEKHSFEIPESMVNSELKAMFESFVRHLAQQGQKFENTGMKIEDFVAKYKDDAEKRVRGFLLVNAIAEAENITVTDEEVEERLKAIAGQVNQPLPKVRQQYEGKNLIGGLKLEIKHGKAIDLVINKAKIKIVKPKK